VRKSQVAAYLATAAETSRLMQANCERAARLIASFRQVSVDQVSDERRRFPLKAYLEEVLASLRPRLAKSRVEVTLDGPADLALDSYPGALGQVVTNLVVNALTHGFPDGAAGHLGLFFEPSPPDAFRLLVSDDGRGVPEAHQAKLFEPFFTTRRGQGGSGLGLNIVYNLVAGRLGGRIAFSPTPGGGASFEIVAPLTAPETAQETAPERAPETAPETAR
jgi:signal transduction histidine kinase